MACVRGSANSSCCNLRSSPVAHRFSSPAPWNWRGPLSFHNFASSAFVQSSFLVSGLNLVWLGPEADTTDFLILFLQSKKIYPRSPPWLPSHSVTAWDLGMCPLIKQFLAKQRGCQLLVRLIRNCPQRWREGQLPWRWMTEQNVVWVEGKNEGMMSGGQQAMPFIAVEWREDLQSDQAGQKTFHHLPLKWPLAGFMTAMHTHSFLCKLEIMMNTIELSCRSNWTPVYSNLHNALLTEPYLWFL